MQMDAGLDTGDMLLLEKLPIAPRASTATLHDQLAALGTHVRGKVWPSMRSEVGDSIMAHIEKNASALQ